MTAGAAQTSAGPTVTTGSTTLRATRINGVAMRDEPAPNTTIAVPGGTVVLNEQIPLRDATGTVIGLVVDGIDLHVDSARLTIGHVADDLAADATTCPVT